MTILTIGNSLCHFINLPLSHYRALRKLLAYTDTSKRIQRNKIDKTTGRPQINAKTGRPSTIIIHPRVPLIDKHGTFPTGLLYLAQEYAEKVGLKYETIDSRFEPTKNQWKIEGAKEFFPLPFTPYDEQAEAGAAAAKYQRGIIVAPTGVGKSAIAALILDTLQLDTLIVVPSVELKNQLTDSLRGIFGDDMAGPLNAGRKAYPITVENIDQAAKMRKGQGFQCVLIDEFHRSGSMTYRELNEKAWGDIYYKFGLTATPFRSNDNEKLLLESVLSQVIYEITYETAVEKGYIVPMEAYYIDLPVIDSKAITWQSAYKELVVNRHDRNEAICNMVMNLHEADIPTLVLVKQIEHGEILQEMLYAMGLEVMFANGKDGNNKELIAGFNHRMHSILIGTTGVLGEGIDTKPCQYVILAGGGKSKNQFMQNVGRSFRKYPGKQSCKIVMFRDASNKWLLEHFNACKKYLKQEYACLPTKL